MYKYELTGWGGGHDAHPSLSREAFKPPRIVSCSGSFSLHLRLQTSWRITAADTKATTPGGHRGLGVGGSRAHVFVLNNQMMK